MTTPVESIDTRPYKTYLKQTAALQTRKNYSRIWVTFALIFSDLLAFLICGILAIAGRAILGLGWELDLLPQALLLFLPCTIN